MDLNINLVMWCESVHFILSFKILLFVSFLVFVSPLQIPRKNVMVELVDSEKPFRRLEGGRIDTTSVLLNSLNNVKDRQMASRLSECFFGPEKQVYHLPFVGISIVRNVDVSCGFSPHQLCQNLKIIEEARETLQVECEVSENTFVLGKFDEPTVSLKTLESQGDPLLLKQWGLVTTNISGSRIATMQEDEMEDVVVAVIDSGIDYFHEDLAGKIWVDPDRADCQGDNIPSDCYGKNFVNASDPSPMDDFGHGTHVAGIIGARRNNGKGIAGIYPNTKLMALKSLDRRGVGAVDAGIEAIDFAIGKGAKILNNSWGVRSASKFLLRALQKAEEHNIIVVSAAGNEGKNNDQEAQVLSGSIYPCSFSHAVNNIICVANTDAKDRLGETSNYGAQTVHLGAPGTKIWSTVPKNEYKRMSGTSMSAPFVAGLAAFVLGYSWKQNRTSEVVELLVQSVFPLESLEGKTTSGGRIDASLILAALP